MRVLTPIIEIAALTVLHAREHLALCRAIAFELIGDDHAWDVLQPFEELAEELLGRLLIASPLYEDIQDVVVLIHRPPQVMTLAMDRQKYLVQMPFIPRLRAPATQAIGIFLPKFPTPLTDRFMGNRDAAFEQEFLHVAEAQGKAIVEPDPVTDNFTREAMILVALGVGWRGACLAAYPGVQLGMERTSSG